MYTSIFIRTVDSRIITLFFVFITVLVHGFYIYTQGGIMSDDSIRYSAWADELIAHDFNIFLVESQGHNYSSQYAVFIYLLALVKVVSGEGWGQMLSAANVFFNAATLYILLLSIYSFTKSRALLLVAGVFYLLSYDILIWTKFVLSDSLYLFVSFLFFATTVNVFKNVNDGAMIRKRLLALSFIVLLLSIFTRPTSIPLIAYFLIVIVAAAGVLIRQKAFYKNISSLLIGVALIALCFMLMLAYLMTDASLWPFDVGKEVVYYYSDRFMDGAVVHDRLATYIHVDKNTMDFLSLILLKFIYFFAVSLDGYSLAHSVANVGWFMPLYIFSAIALLESLRKKQVLPMHSGMAVVLGFLYIFCIVAFTSVTLLDYDHRYRIPILPVLIMMATLGVHASMLRIRENGWKFS